ncbi:4-hydroxythreonine-4-phosphate dehydrogenase PdxA [Merismopedia glauca]|uniref:4-hydroxythreonine-4-phosphate dehydrogenase n=1 Tax=Merismopedia glauca CCAP 1448/3 TaxID=1296344 RepID=A0A2T1C2W6_9CYAN|nr:4-hydroxythreonine-4-phosphate dehydrogenase PdxA [Merismopedia glauca]PSB02616.1 4-hydroxythreonine-4-phosphate dehydrogenase PdxA [Merismopedia glauca CCAP 1448/3]
MDRQNTLSLVADGNTLPKIAIALGDPAGIGTEVVLKALASPEIRQLGQITLIGNRQLLEAAYEQLQAKVGNLSFVPLAEISLLDVPLPVAICDRIRLGEGNAASGEASFAYLETAIARTLAGEFEGIVTAPIAKSAWLAAGHHYPGQTELLAEKSGTSRYGMLFVARSPHTGWMLRTLLATTHIPLRQVSETLTASLMTEKIELLVECLQQDFGVENPQIAIAGLNPHSGEQGQLGTEEIDWLIPWMQQQQKRLPNIKLVGPIPPDTMWVKPGQAWYGTSGESVTGLADAYLALYHDQGLIPVKLMGFDQAINTSIGLPFIRTSPDHGTAFDIAGLGIARANSMQAAIRLAAEIVWVRRK